MANTNPVYRGISMGCYISQRLHSYDGSGLIKLELPLKDSEITLLAHCTCEGADLFLCHSQHRDRVLSISDISGTYYTVHEPNHHRDMTWSVSSMKVKQEEWLQKEISQRDCSLCVISNEKNVRFQVPGPEWFGWNQFLDSINGHCSLLQVMEK